MRKSFEIKSADELLDAEFIAKWQDRKAIDPLAREVLRAILDRFVVEGGPLGLEALSRHLQGRDPDEIREAVARLDQKDLILARDGKVVLAYPFAGTPTAFRVSLPNGRERYAVCAIDALVLMCINTRTYNLTALRPRRYRCPQGGRDAATESISHCPHPGGSTHPGGAGAKIHVAVFPSGPRQDGPPCRAGTVER